MELAFTRWPWKADNRFTEELLRTSEEAARTGASTTTAAEVVAAAAMAAIVDVAAQIAKRNLQNANCPEFGTPAAAAAAACWEE